MKINKESDFIKALTVLIEEKTKLKIESIEEIDTDNLEIIFSDGKNLKLNLKPDEGETFSEHIIKQL